MQVSNNRKQPRPTRVKSVPSDSDDDDTETLMAGQLNMLVFLLRYGKVLKKKGIK